MRRERKKSGKNRAGRMLAAALLFIFAVTLAGGCTKQEQQKEEQEQATGRYTEREVDLNTVYDVMGVFPLEDGGYSVYAKDAPLKLVAADGTETTANSMWRNSLNINVENCAAVSPKGDLVLAYLPQLTPQQYEELGSDLTPEAFLFVDSKGSKRLLEVSGEGYRNDDYVRAMSFASDGALYMANESGNVYRMDTESGALQLLFQAKESIKGVGFYKNILLVLDSSKAWLYDREKNRLLDENKVLNEFIATHQDNGQRIVLCEGKEEEPKLYLGCRTGLYQYVWDGAVVEQIADGQLLSFGNSIYQPCLMQALDNREFRVYFSPSHLVELYFDETLPARPDRTLKVYSLEEDDRIRYAAQLFQKQHPDVLVRYETGMEGDNAVAKEDALKNLNTELLADEGPDVMVLDGMDLEQYAKKGVLKKLDDFLKPYLDDGLLYESIVDGMRMTDTDSIYALPMTVGIPVIASDPDYLEHTENLEGILAGFEKARKEYPEGALILAGTPKSMIGRLIFTSLPAWSREDGSLDAQKLEEFFEAAGKIWEIQKQGMSDSELASLAEEMKDWKDEAVMRPTLGLNSSRNGSWIRFQIGYLSNLYMELAELHLTRGLLASRADEIGMELVWAECGGQAEHVFLAQTVAGICEKAKEPELAEEFYSLLLSDELMDKWWLKSGVPILRASVDRALDKTNQGFGEYSGMSGDFIAQIEREWPDEEEQQRFRDILEQACTPYLPGSDLEALVMEQGLLVMNKEQTPVEAAGEVQKRMAIAMEE